MIKCGMCGVSMHSGMCADCVEAARLRAESPENSPAAPVQQLHPETAPTIMQCFQQMGYGDAKDSAALAARVVAQLSGV